MICVTCSPTVASSDAASSTSRGGARPRLPLRPPLVFGDQRPQHPSLLHPIRTLLHHNPSESCIPSCRLRTRLPAIRDTSPSVVRLAAGIRRNSLPCVHSTLRCYSRRDPNTAGQAVSTHTQLAPRWPSLRTPQCIVRACRPDSLRVSCSRGALFWRPALAESNCYPAAVAPVADSPDMASCTLYSPVSTSALRVVMPSAPAAMLRALQPGPHLCTQSCYAICDRCNAATPGCGETRGRCQSSTPDAGEYVAQMRRHRTHPPHAAANVSRHRPGRTRCRRRTHLHGPAVRKPRRGRSPENRAPVHARGRASGRTQTAGWRSPCCRVEVGGLCGAEGFFCRGLFQEHRRPSRPGTKES